MTDKFRSLNITEAEETALVQMIQLFNDCGLPDDIESDDYDSLSDKVCEPAFWEYNLYSHFSCPLLTQTHDTSRKRHCLLH